MVCEAHEADGEDGGGAASDGDLYTSPWKDHARYQYWKVVDVEELERRRKAAADATPRAQRLRRRLNMGIEE